MNDHSANLMDTRDDGEVHSDDGDNSSGSAAAAEPYKIKGVINDIAITSRGKPGGNETFSVVCAVGKEYRLGNWGTNIKGAKNGAVVFELRKRSREGGVKSDMNGLEDARTAESTQP
jgi:hypothetical protein